MHVILQTILSHWVVLQFLVISVYYLHNLEIKY